MSGDAGFRVVQGFYWLFLGVWVGAMLMLAVGAAITFRTVAEYQPSLGLAPYSDPSLAARAPGILAGAITGNILKALGAIQIVCAVVVVLAAVLQCTVFADRLRGGVTGGANLLRLALIGLPVLILVADLLFISPRIWHHRRIMYDPQRPAAEQVEAKAAFDRYHKLSVRVMGAGMLMLAASVFASAFALSGPAVAAREPAAERLGAPAYR